MRKILFFLSLSMLAGIICVGQQPEPQDRSLRDYSSSAGLHDQSPELIKKLSEGYSLTDIRKSLRPEKISETQNSQRDVSRFQKGKGLPLSKQRFSNPDSGKIPSIPLGSVLRDGQCNYTFTLLDSWGDGWNGALMHVLQNGQIVAVLGTDFNYGDEFIQEVALTDGLEFEVFWHEGGGWPEEVGLKITDPFGDQIYYQEFIGWDSIGTTLFADVAICTPPTCPRPSNLVLLSADTDSALINWTENGNATQWDIEFGTPGFSEGEGTLLTGITSKPYEIIGLSSATEYEVRVRSLCDAEDISLWSARLKFNTSCELFEAPYLENFDNVTVPHLPLCWNVLTTGYWAMSETTEYFSNSSPNSLVLVYEYESAVYLSMPEFDHDINDLFVSFSAMLWYGWNQLEIGVLGNSNDPNTFTSMQTFTISEGWNIYTADLTSYTGPNGVITFKFGFTENNYYGVVALDDIYVGVMEDCPPPMQLGASHITYESARLNWNPFGPSQEWEVEYGVQGFEHGQGTMVEGITQTYVDIAGLEENTWYQFYVRSVCDDEPGSWSMPFTFKTFFEGECFYTFILHDTYGDGWDETRMHVIQNGETVAILGQGFQYGYTFEVDVLLMEGLEFEVFWAISGWYPDEIGLEIIDPFSEQLYYQVPVGWNMVGKTIFADVAICSTPTCPRPNNLAASEITTESALLNWTENGAATQWDVEYGLAGFTEGQGTIITGITNKPYQLADLESGTYYEFRVRAVCSEEDISYWSTRKSFATLCDDFSLPLIEGFDNVLPPDLPICWTGLGAGEFYFVETNDYFSSSAPNSVVLAHDYFSLAMLIAPPLEEVVNNVQLRFKSLYYEGNNKLNVGVITDPTDVSTFTTVQTITHTGYGVWNEQLVYFVNYTEGDGQIAFMIGSLDEANYSLILIDDVEIDYLPSCPAPFGLSASDITAHSAQLTWNDIGNGTEWDLEWGVAPFSPGNGTLVQGISQTAYQLTELSASTSYQFYVRAVCAENETSAWSGPYTFATECGAADLPITENFDLLYNGDLPYCWSMLGLGSWGWNYYVGATSWQSYSSPMSMAIYQDYTLAMLITPELAAPVQSLEVSFYAMHAEGEDNALKLGVVAHPGNASGFELITTVSTTSQWKKYTILLENYTGSAKYLAFALGQAEGQKWGTVLIDDLQIVSSGDPIYNVTFKVHNANLDPIAGASIEIEGEGTIITQPNGETTHGLHNGHYQFTINADNYAVYSGVFDVINDHLTIDITLLSVNVEESFAEGIILYPNPFDDQFYIRNAENLSKIIISNVTGQKFMEKDLTGDQSVKINTSTWAKGVYFVQVYHHNGLSAVRIVVKR
ncbi:MAG: T9SS C-terminal target domain-containing protein [Bacteroidetes bacterium]|nr:MAG: T9SS C-terminal target domain-containing protein [Bacteroidota bacterium]